MGAPAAQSERSKRLSLSAGMRGGANVSLLLGTEGRIRIPGASGESRPGVSGSGADTEKVRDECSRHF